MAALAADRQTKIVAGGATRMAKWELAANAKIWNGALVAKNATGYLVPASDTAALKVVGIAQEAADNTGGADGALSIHIITGVRAVLDNDGNINQAAKGTLCTVKDDHTVSTAAVTVNDVIAGLVEAFDAATVTVYVDDVIGQTA